MHQRLIFKTSNPHHNLTLQIQIKFTYLLIYYTELSLSVKFNLKELEKLLLFLFLKDVQFM